MNTKLLALATLVVGIQQAHADFPENNLNLQDDINFTANITEKEFNEIIDTIVVQFQPMAKMYGATLTAVKNWSDSTVNAYANQNGNNWEIDMFGGLARRDEVTKDGFALVVCHELGHHFGGFPLKGSRWAASEGQSDYFATQACGRKIWMEQHDENAKSRVTVDPIAKKACDSKWTHEREQNLCYRIAMAGHSLAHLLAVLGGGTDAPKFDTPDKSKVQKTSESHPAAQCRLDTYFAGGLCNENFDLAFIPGKNNPKGQQSVEAEWQASMYSCAAIRGFQNGLRPECWFKAEIVK